LSHHSTTSDHEVGIPSLLQAYNRHKKISLDRLPGYDKMIEFAARILERFDHGKYGNSLNLQHGHIATITNKRAYMLKRDVCSDKQC